MTICKSPKIYFYDTGLLCWLLGIQDASQITVHPLRGSIFETFIVSELMKTRFNRMLNTVFYFWRDSSGNEIDVLADYGGKLMPIEVKSGQTLNRDFFTGLTRWASLAGEQVLSPTLVYGGAETTRYKGVRVFNWRDVDRIFERKL